MSAVTDQQIISLSPSALLKAIRDLEAKVEDLQIARDAQDEQIEDLVTLTRDLEGRL